MLFKKQKMRTNELNAFIFFCILQEHSRQTDRSCQEQSVIISSSAAIILWLRANFIPLATPPVTQRISSVPTNSMLGEFQACLYSC